MFLTFQRSPRKHLLSRFTLALIEHFVDPDDKSHQKYSQVSNLEFLMFPRDEQMLGQFAKRLCLGEAVSKVSFHLMLCPRFFNYYII